jgi:hypothetical protein
VDLVCFPEQTPVLVQQSGSIRLENHQGPVYTLLDICSVDSFTAGFLNGGGESNHDISDPAPHLGRLLSLTAMMIQTIIQNDGVVSL